MRLAATDVAHQPPALQLLGCMPALPACPAGTGRSLAEAGEVPVRAASPGPGAEGEAGDGGEDEDDANLRGWWDRVMDRNKRFAEVQQYITAAVLHAMDGRLALAGGSRWSHASRGGVHPPAVVP